MKSFFRTVGGGLARFFGAIWRFIKRHKGLSVASLVLVVGGAAALVVFTGLQAGAQTAGFSMPETTALARMDLELTVTATGTLQSTSVQEVTSDLSYDVAAVHVAVGDTVEAGQLLATLDAAELDEAIADLREDIADADKEDAKNLSRLETSLQEATDQRESNWNKNEQTIQDAADAIEAARVAAGKAAGEQAVTRGLEQAVAADAATQAAQAEMNSAQTAYDMAETGSTVAQAEYEAALTSGDKELIAEKEEARKTANTALKEAEKALEEAENTYEAAKKAAESSWRSANEKSVYDKAYNKAHKKADVSAQQSAYDNAVEMRDSTYENDTKSIETAQQNYDAQAEKDSAEDLRDQLEELLEQKTELDILSPISGTVMEVNAEEGQSAGGSGGASSTAGGSDGTAAGGTGSSSASAGSALFTIENENSLEIPVSVAEYDAVGMESGLSATVTSDALEDKEWSATVMSVSPKAADGYFTVMVEITSPVDELAVGMSATVDIITEARQDVYAVPYDAVVTNEAGQTVVYALGAGRPGGSAEDEDDGLPAGEDLPQSMPEGAGDADGQEGTGPGRTEIVVETGLETDYYIEISGEGLSDGLMILNDPLGLTVTTDDSADEASEDAAFAMPGGGGAMPPGDGGAMPDGNRPSGAPPA